MGFQDYTVSSFYTGAAPYVGFANYLAVFRGPQFAEIVVNTVLFTAGSLVFQFGIGLALALFFRRVFPLNAVLRSLLLVPWLLPLVVSGTVWRWMLYNDSLIHGRVRVHVDAAAGLVSFQHAVTGAEVLREEPIHFWWPGSRHFDAVGGGFHRIEQRFAAYPDERFYGLGQHGHGRLDQKGMVLELAQRNGEVSIPFAVSSRGYGLLWNSPAVGRVEFAANGTRWVADRARQLDYWLTIGDSPAAILTGYAGATGFPSPLPEWASGFWQSKLRYRNQDELLAVAREYARRGLPLSVLVIDYLHWRHLGDWDFDPKAWPDPRSMVEELRALGIEPAVSVWPSVSPLSGSYIP